MDHEPLSQFHRFTVERVTYRTERGETISRDVVRHPGSVAIVPMLDDGRVCLIKNYRISVGETLIEIPAGTLQPNETPLACARRELIEETGYRAAKFDQLTAFYAAPGILDEFMHLFVASGLRGGDSAREPGEQIENHIVTIDEAKSLISDGRIRDAKTMVGLLMYLQFVSQN